SAAAWQGGLRRAKHLSPQADAGPGVHVLLGRARTRPPRHGAAPWRGETGVVINDVVMHPHKAADAFSGILVAMIELDCHLCAKAHTMVRTSGALSSIG